MMLRQQKAVVRRLSRLSAGRAAEAEAHRKAVLSWKQKRIGTAGTLAWFFAAGTLWGAGKRHDNKDGSGLPGLAVGAANTSLLAWQFLNDTASAVPDRGAAEVASNGDDPVTNANDA